MGRKAWGMWAVLLTVGVAGCCHPAEITCYSLSNPCEPEGIPFYLPKPLLIVSKNFRNLEASDHGEMGAAPIPNSFDHQAEYADVKANVSTAPAPATAPSADPSAAPAKAGKTQSGALTTPDSSSASAEPAVLPPGSFKDGATPDTFYTYQIIFVPDLTQKYALKIKGGPGEVRAAMSLVNGWMFTGLGPFYLKDSSTAQNILATGGAITLGGRGVADVVTSVADLRKSAGVKQSGAFDATQLANRITQIRLFMDQNSLRPVPLDLPAFAEIYIYEPVLTDGAVEWRRIVDHSFNRQILGMVTSTAIPPAAPVAGPETVKPPAANNPQAPGTPNPSGGNPNPVPVKPKTTNPSDSSQAPPGTPTPQFGMFDSDQSGYLENAITQGMANRFTANNPVLQPGYPRPQSGAFSAAPSGTGAAAGNNVTVNVNPEKRGCLSCLWPFSKLCKESKRPRIEQDVVVAPDGELINSTTATPVTPQIPTSVEGATEMIQGYKPPGT